MKEKSALNTKRLTPAECAVVISIAILSKAGTPTTPKKIADYLKEDVQTVRNILERLRNKGLVISSLAFGLGGLAGISPSSQVSGRERIHRFVDDIENILDQCPEILEWTKVNLGIEDKKKLMEFINERAEKLRLESKGVMPLEFPAEFPVPHDRMRLHIPAFLGYVDVVKVLLERGADPRIADNRGHIPLDYAEDSTIRSLLESALKKNELRDSEGLQSS